MTDEPRYVGVGEEFDDDDQWTPNRRPKWMSPSTQTEVLILRTVHRKYYPDKNLRHEVVMIAKNPNKYPIEWIKDRCDVVTKMRKKRKLVGLKGLITMITREDDLNEFMLKNRNKFERKKVRKPDISTGQ